MHVVSVFREKQMDRRKFIKSAGIATGAAAATTLATPAIAQATKDMVIVSTWPRDFPGLGTGAQRAAARITEPVSYTHLTLPTTPYV
jgi:TRAP-type mannitol/chloroaromatic compound transport system substrate-binding protein